MWRREIEVSAELGGRGRRRAKGAKRRGENRVDGCAAVECESVENRGA